MYRCRPHLHQSAIFSLNPAMEKGAAYAEVNIMINRRFFFAVGEIGLLVKLGRCLKPPTIRRHLAPTNLNVPEVRADKIALRPNLNRDNLVHRDGIGDESQRISTGFGIRSSNGN
jgi:hypothetical protein